MSVPQWWHNLANRTLSLLLSGVAVVIQWYFTESIISAAITLLVLLAIVLLSEVLTTLMSASWQDSLLFFRLQNPTPQSRCHQVARADEQIDTEEAERRWSDIFNDDLDPSTRQDFFEKSILNKSQEEKTVQAAQSDYRIARQRYVGLTLLGGSVIIVDGIASALALWDLHNSVYIAWFIIWLATMFWAQNAAKTIIIEAMLIPLSQPLSPIAQKENEDSEE